jgi:predicted RNA-binding Zn ribbon-like protein
MISTSEAAQASLIGGSLCLDFTNTVGSRHDADLHDKLKTYADLVAWSRHAGLLSERTARQLLEQAARDSAMANAAHTRAITLREAIYRIFSAANTGHRPKNADIEILNQALGRALAQARIVATGENFEWDWDANKLALDQMLGPIARAAAELLTSPQLAQVRACANETCGWLFIDASRNHSRRWCDMSDCGNRAKARRHYAKLRALN